MKHIYTIKIWWYFFLYKMCVNYFYQKSLLFFDLANKERVKRYAFLHPEYKTGAWKIKDKKVIWL